MLQKILAWCVHCYTALGLATAALSTALIVIGGEENLRNSLTLLFIAMAIDASDGYFARLARVKEVVPTINNRRSTTRRYYRFPHIHKHSVIVHLAKRSFSG